MNRSHEQPEELDVIRRAAAGDQQAFTELVNHYTARLRWLIRVRLDPVLRARVSADDVLQDAMVVVSKQIEGLDVQSEPAFWSWLCSVVEHRLIDARRRHVLTAGRDARREQQPGRGPANASSMSNPLPPAAVTAPSARLRTTEQREMLEKALDQLPESYREVIVLRIVEGLPLADTAAIMNRSRGAVSVLLTKALKRLNSVIQQNPEAKQALDLGTD